MKKNDRKSDPKHEVQKLLKWYHANKRDLPWRKNREPYPIWISETMLQQTTTTAVIPYFERFLKNFSTLNSLAQAPLHKVLENWAGLGYYSRARHLHQAAKKLAKLKKFPRRHQELLELPGFGPYTARAVSSLAFSEPVGVLDGNVIRVLSRQFNLAVEWWRPKERQRLQSLSDELAQSIPHHSHEINQALMELGSQICVPKNPHCLLCPWISTCWGRKAQRLHSLPLKKSQRPREIWLWKAEVRSHKKNILLVKNNYAPFLRDDWLMPGTTQLLTRRPAQFHFRHSITHHDIFVQVVPKKLRRNSTRDAQKGRKTQSPESIWVDPQQIDQYAPFSLVKKVVKHAGL